MKIIKKIIHVDMDYFYAQVEEVENPTLKNVPVGIGGLLNGKRGVLCTSNYHARKFGVKAAMPTLKALSLCPELKLIKPNFEKYKEVSLKVFKIFSKFTTTIETISLDEAYLDVTECKMFHNDALKIAKEIKRLILKETGLTASAGVSYNKLLAKIGSDLFKPNGLAVLRPNDIVKNIEHFSVSKISGVGKVTQEKMEKLNIKTFKDLQKYSKLDLVNLFGNFGPVLYNYCRGEDVREVHPQKSRKSLSVERTFMEDLIDKETLLFYLKDEYRELTERLNKHSDLIIKSIIFKIKYHDFSVLSVEKKMELRLENIEKIFNEKVTQDTKAIRLLGIGVRFYSTKCEKQLILPIDSLIAG